MVVGFSSSLTPHIILKDYPDTLTKHESKGTSKIPAFKLYSELGKIWKCRLVFLKINPNFPSFLRIGKNLQVYPAQDQHFKIQILNLWMNWENLCPNLSITNENKMDNSNKKGLVTF